MYMPNINKNKCPHPKNRRSKYMDSNNVYVERCIKCTKIIYSRKFTKGVI